MWHWWKEWQKCTLIIIPFPTMLMRTSTGDSIQQEKLGTWVTTSHSATHHSTQDSFLGGFSCCQWREYSTTVQGTVPPVSSFACARLITKPAHTLRQLSNVCGRVTLERTTAPSRALSASHCGFLWLPTAHFALPTLACLLLPAYFRSVCSKWNTKQTFDSLLWFALSLSPFHPFTADPSTPSGDSPQAGNWLGRYARGRLLLLMFICFRCLLTSQRGHQGEKMQVLKE